MSRCAQASGTVRRVWRTCCSTLTHAMLPSPMSRHVEIGTGLVRGSGLLDSRRSLWFKKRYMIFLRSWPLCAERSQMNHIENFKLSRGGYFIFESVRVWVKIGAQLHLSTILPTG